MDGDGGDLLEDMDYGDFALLEEPSGDFSFEGTFDGESQDFNESGSFSQQPPQQLQHPMQQQQPKQQQQQLQPPAALRSMGSAPGVNGSITNVTTSSSNMNNNFPSNSNNSAAMSNRSSQSGTDSRTSFGRQPWHNDEKDRDSRRRMIIEIAQLLRARKRTQPSDVWLRQLPCKARKLEERLYRSAPTFEIYEDKTTLKNRLKKLARAIMNQYERTSTRSSIRSSVSSRASTISTATGASRNSVVSHLQQHRDSFMSASSLDSLSALNNQMKQQMSGLGNNEQRGMPNGSNDNSGSNNNSVGPAQVGLRPIPEDKTNNNGDKISILEHQKQANERLQQQIMENIRKQEELLRRLQMQAPGGGSNMMQQQPNSGQSNMMMQQQQQQPPNSAASQSNNLMSNNSNNSRGGQSTSSWQGNASTSSGNTLPQQQQQPQPPHQQQQQRFPGNVNGGSSNVNNNGNNGMPGSLNNFMPMNPSAMSNPAQMQQLAQMQALLRSGGMAQMQPNNPLMRSVSAGSNNNPGNMMGGFGGSQPQQGQQQPSQGQQQNSLAMANMMGQNMMGLQAPPVLPGRATTTGSISGFAGFNPSMPPPPGGGPQAQGNNAASFSQYNWRTNT